MSRPSVYLPFEVQSKIERYGQNRSAAIRRAFDERSELARLVCDKIQDLDLYLADLKGINATLPVRLYSAYIEAGGRDPEISAFLQKLSSAQNLALKIKLIEGF